MPHPMSHTARDVINQVREMKRAAVERGEKPTHVDLTPDARAAFELATKDELQGVADVSEINMKGMKEAVRELFRLTVASWDAPVIRIW